MLHEKQLNTKRFVNQLSLQHPKGAFAGYTSGYSICLLSLSCPVFAYVLLLVCRKWACSVIGDELVSFSKPDRASRWSLEEQPRPRQTAHLPPKWIWGGVLSFYTDKSEAHGITVLSSQGRHYQLGPRSRYSYGSPTVRPSQWAKKPTQAKEQEMQRSLEEPLSPRN